jgi:catechol 2,3-dioxygenase-like lactoylglutathione lyase family enzyme
VAALAVETSVPAALTLTATAKAALAAVGLLILGGLAALFWPARVALTTATTPNPLPASSMKIKITSVMVNDQDQALQFYTEVLGFVKKTDLPAGGGRWLTVVSPAEPDGAELLLEPMGFPPADTYQGALFRAGIPLTALMAEDVQKKYEEMTKLGVVFSMKPTKAGPTTVAVFDDTCGNRIQIFQAPGVSNSAAPLALKITLNSVMVEDQETALKFYTEVLGFTKKRDMPVGDGRWLTVVSPAEPDGMELLLEPMGFAPAKTYQEALFAAGIPLTSFAVEDIQKEYERLKKLGVTFRTEPRKMGPVTVAVIEDTCGNLIQLAQR